MPPILTIFAAPKAFVGAAATNQHNAVWSWMQLGPEVEVILLGDEAGIAEASTELGTRHLPTVERSPAGVPLLGDVFRVGQEAATGQTCLFVNADIVLGSDLLSAVRGVAAWAPRFLMIGQRWDTLIDQRLEALGPHWWRQTHERAVTQGKLDSFLWIDYFAFPRGQYHDLPPFVIGRPGYDNWLVWHTRECGIPIVDASRVVTAVHQRHDYAQYGGTKKHVWTEDAQTNADLIGDRRKLFTIGHATHRLTHDRLEPARGVKYTAARLYTRSRPVIDATATVRHKIGLDAELVQRLTTPLRRRQQRVDQG